MTHDHTLNKNDSPRRRHRFIGADAFGHGTAERIRLARTDAKLTQEALADACVAAQPTLARIESRGCRDVALLARIAEVCRVNPAWLAFGDPYDMHGLGTKREPEPMAVWLSSNPDRPHPSTFPIFSKMYRQGER